MPANLPLDNLDRVSFGGITIPTISYTFKGSARVHTHEYKKVIGGRNEKSGRKLYESRISAAFHQTGALKGAPAWPDNLHAIREMFEREESAILVLPTIGNVNAVIVDFESTYTAKIRSGEDAQLTFLEDEDNTFQDIIPIDDVRDIAGKAVKLEQLTAALPSKPNVFDQINNAVNQVLAYRDQFRLYGSLVASKIANLALILEEADRTLELLNDPVNWEITEALQQLWAATINLTQSPGNQVVPARKFTVTRRSTVAQVSSNIFGDASRARDLLALNFFEDALAIPAGTEVLYIPD
jgi:hypothetical protein